MQKSKPHSISGLRKTNLRTVVPCVAVLMLLLISQPLAAQETPLHQRIDIPEQRTTVYKLLSQISDSIGYFFVYDSQVVNSDKRLRYGAQNTPVKKVLNDILADTELSFRVLGQHILIQSNWEEATQEPSPEDSIAFHTIRGTVIDYDTREPIPFATVGIKEAGMGNITNTDGAFILRIPTEFASDTIIVSHIGYQPKSYPAELLIEGKVDLYLHIDHIPLQEVIIRNVDPDKLVNDALAKIHSNYSQEPVYLTSFYREGIIINSKLLNYTEAVFSIYKPSYGSRFDKEQVRLLKSRTTHNVDHTDTLVIKLKGGIGSILNLDIISNSPTFLNPDFMVLYNFYKVDIVTINSKTTYAIGFEQKNTVTEPLLKGILYIDMESLSILKAEFEINPAMVGRTTQQYVARRTRGYRIKAKKISYTVTYTQYEGTYHLSHVRGELHFRYRRRNRIRSNSFEAFLEMATSRIETQDVSRFPRRTTTPTTRVLTDMGLEYDPEFWENLNYIAPEESIHSTLKEITSRIEQVAE